VNLVTTLMGSLHGALSARRTPSATVAVRRANEDVEVAHANAGPSTLFEIGSITKVMTATLVLQHVQQGHITLDDPVSEHLPGLVLSPPEVTRLVTVRHLLTHTSGIDVADDFSDTGDGDDCLERYVAEAVGGARLLSTPGQQWSYCNGGFVLLGRLVEVLDGRPWDDALASRVFRPLGLSATTTARLRPEMKVAIGHRYDHCASAVVREPGRMPRSAGPAGNVVATAADLVTFANALVDGSDLLGPELVEEMLSPQLQFRRGHQGLAWWLPGSGRAVHGGTTRGFSALLVVIRNVGSLCVLANGPDAGAIAGTVQEQLFGPSTPPSSLPPLDGPDPGPESYVGRYERRHVVVDVTFDGTTLNGMIAFHGPAAELFPAPEPVTLAREGGGRFLIKNQNGDETGIWDFLDFGTDNVPTRLLTQRMHVRSGC
jgi:CubicO group peptidase (beta-lactamase class C family)